jgi:hypothetical protein
MVRIKNITKIKRMLKKNINLSEIKNYLLLKKLILIGKNKTTFLLVKSKMSYLRTITIFIRITLPKISHKNTNNHLIKERLMIILMKIKLYFLIAIISNKKKKIFKTFNNNRHQEKREIKPKIII